MNSSAEARKNVEKPQSGKRGTVRLYLALRQLSFKLLGSCRTTDHGIEQEERGKTGISRDKKRTKKQADYLLWLSSVCSFLRFNLENAVENNFTAKTPRAQRTYSKDKIHPIGEDQERTHFHSNPCFSLASLRLGGGSLNSYCGF